MSSDPAQPITELLGRWQAGDPTAEAELVREVYPVLQRLAAMQMRKHGSRSTLRVTEVVNEAYLRLHEQNRIDWQSRGHFFAIAATMMRRVLVDYLRERGSAKRGGGIVFVPEDQVREHDLQSGEDPMDWLAVDQILSELERSLPDVARVVELRLFGGLSVDEITLATGSSSATVGRHWRFAKAWLAERLEVDADQFTE